jgi:hypothetical protein
LRLCWLLRGAGEALEDEPDAELPRCWPKKLGVAEGAWLCRGETGPAGAEALEAAADGGLEDMAPPGWVEAEVESKTTADAGVGGWLCCGECWRQTAERCEWLASASSVRVRVRVRVRLLG